MLPYYCCAFLGMLWVCYIDTSFENKTVWRVTRLQSKIVLETPFDSSVHLFPVNNDDEIFNQKDYASIIGSLHYATDCFRPNIAYAVGVLSKFTIASLVKIIG